MKFHPAFSLLAGSSTPSRVFGEYSRVGASSVVLHSVPPGCTAVGVPAKLINCAGADRPSQEMNQVIDEAGAGI